MSGRELGRTLVSSALVLLAYFLVPYGQHLSSGDIWLRGTVLAAVLALLVLVVSRRVERELRADDGPERTGPLVVALVAGVATFALADLVVATTMPGQFSDLSTKIDALYFSLTTLTTVGYGDAHAAGQVARALVVVQLVFDVVVLATAARALVGAGRRARSDRRRSGGAGESARRE